MSSSSNGHYAAAIEKKHTQACERHQEKLHLDGDAASRACQKDKIHIEKLQKELSNCYQEIEYLQDQLNLRNVEANFMGEHIHSLELKLTDLEKFPERVRVMGNELVQSDSQCLLLMEELRGKDEELKKSAFQMQKLDNLVLDYQCEIESLKLDLTSMERSLFEAESFGHQVAEENARMGQQLKEFEFELQNAKQVISHLEVENKQLKELLPEKEVKRSSFTAEKQPHEPLQEMDNNIGRNMDCTFLEKMAKQNQESELLVEQLKEELREQKLKAKEDAEDLTQEMAELRYQITGMLEEEYKRRAYIEQAAIQRIQELESQVSKEQKKWKTALKHLQELQDLAQRQSMEIRKLKNALEMFNSTTDLRRACTTSSCSCAVCATSLESSSDSSMKAFADIESCDGCIEMSSNQALIGWYPDEISIDRGIPRPAGSAD